MNCREFTDFLDDYVDGHLPGDQSATFEQHMRDCPPCVDYLESYRETAKLGRALCEADEALPSDVPERLIAAILAARRS